MSVSISYNGYSIPLPLGKFQFRELKDSARFSTDFAIPPGDVATAVAALEPDDKSFSISTTAGGFSRAFTLATNAVALVAEVEKVGSPLDSEGLQKLRFSVVIEKQDLTRAAGEAGFREYFVTADLNPNGLKVISIEGIVTSTGATGAETNYDNNIDTIANAFLTAFGGVYESPLEQKKFLRRNLDTLLSFRREYVQLAEEFNKLVAGVDTLDTQILFTKFVVVEETVNEKGNDDPNLKTYAIEWGATLHKSKSFSKSEVEENILGLVLKRLTSDFGESVILIGSNQISWSRTNLQAGARWLFRADQGGVTINFVETIIQDILFAQSEKLLNGRPFEGQMWSAGLSGKITQVVEHTTQDAPPEVPSPPVLAGGFPAGAKLVAESRQIVEGSTNVGRSVGSGGSEGRTTVDYTRTFTTVWNIHVPPEDVQIADVAGVVGDLERSIGLY